MICTKLDRKKLTLYLRLSVPVSCSVTGAAKGGQADICEKQMAALFNCEQVLVVTSGTGALICGLVGLGIGPGDEVIIPAYTWLASAGAVLSVGAIPVLSEVNETLTLQDHHLWRRWRASDQSSQSLRACVILSRYGLLFSRPRRRDDGRAVSRKQLPDE